MGLYVKWAQIECVFCGLEFELRVNRCMYKCSCRSNEELIGLCIVFRSMYWEPSSRRIRIWKRLGV